MPEVKGLVRGRRRRNELWLTIANENGAVRETFAQLGAKEVEDERLTLEDLFIDYTGGSGS